MVARKKSQIAKFISKAHSILWALDTGPASQHKSYNEWEECVVALMKRHGWTRYQAAIQVSKDYKQLKDLFIMFDVADLDPAPGIECGRWDVHATDKQKAEAQVKCEEKDIPYREQLRWALDTAGRYVNNEEEPVTCPCWGAYFLYVQAKDNPKEFMTKLGQAESKFDSEAERVAGHTKSSKRSVVEINEMLDELLNDEPEEFEEDISE